VKANRGIPVLTHNTPAGGSGYRDGKKLGPNYLEKVNTNRQIGSLSEIQPAPPRAAAPPPSMVAIGGKPGTGRPIPGYDPTFAPHDGFAVAWNVNVVTMLNALAVRADRETAERRALEARVAALEAERSSVAQGLIGLARAMLAGR